jgi:hypothetical protein
MLERAGHAPCAAACFTDTKSVSGSAGGPRSPGSRWPSGPQAGPLVHVHACDGHEAGGPAGDERFRRGGERAPPCRRRRYLPPRHGLRVSGQPDIPVLLQGPLLDIHLDKRVAVVSTSGLRKSTSVGRARACTRECCTRVPPRGAGSLKDNAREDPCCLPLPQAV